VTARTQDEAFHEIQLNGKQLLFLFMAATVVSVVIFLCGTGRTKCPRRSRACRKIRGPERGARAGCRRSDSDARDAGRAARFRSDDGGSAAHR
jgi:hypothetical protein